MKCHECNLEFDNYLKLSKHIKFTHKITSQEYYDKHIGKTYCVICAGETKFSNINCGYVKTCSHTCGGILHRSNLKSNPEKFNSLREKVTKNMEEFHKNMTDEYRNKRLENMSHGVSNFIKSLTDEEKKEKFGWLNKLEGEEWQKAVEKLKSTGYHNWWKTASEEQKIDVYVRRFKNWGKKTLTHRNLHPVSYDQEKVNKMLNEIFNL